MARLVSARTGKQYTLSTDKVVIGRHPSCHIRVLEKQVSRKHCSLELREGRWVLVDAGSMLGTVLNDELLTAPERLQAGDTIKIGTELFTFDDEGESRHKPMTLRPLSQATPHELVPPDAVEVKQRRLPRVIGLSVAAAVVLSVVLIVILTWPTPSKAIHRAVTLVRARKARGLWELVTHERKKTLNFEEFEEHIDMLPDEALVVLGTLKVGKWRDTGRGTAMHVTVWLGDTPLADEVVLVREDGQWKFDSAPEKWLAEVAKW